MKTKLAQCATSPNYYLSVEFEKTDALSSTFVFVLFSPVKKVDGIEFSSKDFILQSNEITTLLKRADYFHC